MDIDNFISMEEAVKISGYKRSNLAYLCRNGLLEGARKIGNHWLIPREVLENYKPSPRGFAVVWERRRAKEAALNDEIKSALEQAAKHKDGK